MVPPNVQNKRTAPTHDWSGDSQSSLDTAKSPCQENCHSSNDSPKTFGGFAKKAPSPWFFDTQRNNNPNNPFDDQSLKTLQSWLAQNDVVTAASTSSKPISQPPMAQTTPLPSTLAVTPTSTAKPKSEVVAANNQVAQELERQARLSFDPAKKLRFHLAALNFYHIAQNTGAATGVLDLLEQESKQTKNETGLRLIAAERRFAAGKTDDALKAYRELETSLGAAKDQAPFRQQVQWHHSLLLQQVAAQRLPNDRPGALGLLREALSLTPSEQLAAQVLRLIEGPMSLKDRREEVEALQKAITDLRMVRIDICNANIHTANQPADDFKLQDLDAFSRLAGMPSRKTRGNEPDLSAYKDLPHLSHQKKLQLYYLELNLKQLRPNYEKTRKDVLAVLTAGLGEDPGADAEAIDSRLLKGAAKEFAPDASLAYRAVGELYLNAKDYPKAVEALRQAVGVNPSNLSAQQSLGEACFGNGESQAASDTYTAILEKNPHDIATLRLRAEAKSLVLASLHAQTQADEVAKAQKEITSDQALILALQPDAEKSKLAELEKKLANLHDSDQKKLAIDGILTLGRQYLGLADQEYANAQDTELVRSKLNGLAAECFGIVSRFAKEDADPAIKKIAPLCEGYRLLAEGKDKDAIAVFQPLRGEFPEVEKIVAEWEKQTLRAANLTALEAWEVINKEGEEHQKDSADGIGGRVLDFADKKLSEDGKGLDKRIQERWSTERQLVAKLGDLIRSGKADTIKGALKQIQASGPEGLKAQARYYIEDGDRLSKGWPIGNLIDYVEKIPPTDKAADWLLQQAFTLEYDNNAVFAPVALYSVVATFGPSDAIKKRAQGEIEALRGNSNFARSAVKFVASMSPESLAFDVALMFASAGLGNLAKAATLARMGEGYEALVAARAVGIGVEGLALGTGNLAKEAVGHDVKKVFTGEHILKTYGATLIMIGGLKGFGAVGEAWGPRAARSLNLVAEGGSKLSAGGEVLVWGVQHSTGITGIIAASQGNQAWGLSGRPVGGWKENTVQNVLGYIEFAVAHKTADVAIGGKMTAVGQKQVNEIALREAVIKAKLQADALGFKAALGVDGKPVDSPARQLMIGLLVDAKFNKVGFSGDKLAQLAADRNFEAANDYFREFGLPLQFGSDGRLTAMAPGEVSPHAALGIAPGKFKANQRPVAKTDPVDLYLKKLGERASKWIEQALENLFGPPGGGGFGGMQPAFAGAYNMVTRGEEAKAGEAKGPPVLQMAGENNGGGGNGRQPTKVTVPRGENIHAILSRLQEELQDPTKHLILVFDRPPDKPADVEATILAHNPKARVEVHQPKGQKVVTEGKRRMNDFHPDMFVDGGHCLIDASKGGVTEPFLARGKNGEVLLDPPEGVTHIEIQVGKPPTREEIDFLVQRAAKLGVEIRLSGEFNFSVKKGAKGLETKIDSKLDPKDIDLLVQRALDSDLPIDVEISVSQRLSIKPKADKKDAEVVTSDPKTAAIAPDRIVLQLDKPPSGADLQGLRAQGVKKIRFSDDPKAADWLLRSLDAMKNSSGLEVRALDAAGKVLWENIPKAEGDAFKSKEGLMRDSLIAYAKAEAWTHRFAEMKKLLGLEGNRFDFKGDVLLWSAAHDLADGTIPKGGKEPKISAELFEQWLKRGQVLAAFKYDHAVKAGNSKADLQRELSPYASGFSTDPTSPDGWSRAVAGMQAYFAKHPDNPPLLTRVFDYLKRDAGGSEAFESNAFELARLMGESRDPDAALKDLDGFYSLSDKIQIRGALFGSFLRTGAGSTGERATLNSLYKYAEEYTTQGYSFVIEGIPTSKSLQKSTPDFAVTASKDGISTRFYIESKEVSGTTLAKKNNKQDTARDLENSFDGKKSDDSTAGTQIGKGLRQLNLYERAHEKGILILEVHLGQKPPDYLVEAVKDFLGEKAPNSVVKIYYSDMVQKPLGQGRFESVSQPTSMMIYGGNSRKMKGYETSSNNFAALDTVSK